MASLTTFLPRCARPLPCRVAFAAKVAAIVLAVSNGGCAHCMYTVQVAMPPAADPDAAGCDGCPLIDGLEAPICTNLGSKGRICSYDTRGYEDDPRSRFATLPAASCSTCNPSRAGGLDECVSTSAGPGCVFKMCGG